MDAADLERIARKVLRELGAGDAEVTLERGAGPDSWRVVVGGAMPMALTIRCGRGTTAEYVRTQIFEQFQRH